MKNILLDEICEVFGVPSKVIKNNVEIERSLELFIELNKKSIVVDIGKLSEFE